MGVLPVQILTIGRRVEVGTVGERVAGETPDQRAARGELPQVGTDAGAGDIEVAVRVDADPVRAIETPVAARAGIVDQAKGTAREDAARGAKGADRGGDRQRIRVDADVLRQTLVITDSRQFRGASKQSAVGSTASVKATPVSMPFVWKQRTLAGLFVSARWMIQRWPWPSSVIGTRAVEAEGGVGTPAAGSRVHQPDRVVHRIREVERSCPRRYRRSARSAGRE